MMAPYIIKATRSEHGCYTVPSIASCMSPLHDGFTSPDFDTMATDDAETYFSQLLMSDDDLDLDKAIF